DLVPGQNATLRARVCPLNSQIYGNFTNLIKFFVNGTQVGSRQFYNASLYAGNANPPLVLPDSVITSYTIPSGLLAEGSNQFAVSGLSYEGIGFSTWAYNTRFLFDWCEVTYPRRLKAHGDQLLLSTANGNATPQRVRVTGFNGADLLLFDLT